MAKDIKVFALNSTPDHKAYDLEKLLKDGWTVQRADQGIVAVPAYGMAASNYGGPQQNPGASSYGGPMMPVQTVVYILERAE